MNALGIDIGGSGVKSALVEIETGKLLSERSRTKTPKPATPKALKQEIRMHIEMHQWDGPVGIGFPAAIVNNQVMTASNIDKSWIGTDIVALLEKESKNRVTALNDADAAGLAEMRLGAGKEINGIVILVTIGTGIGTAIFNNGTLLPNTEFGHMFLENGIIAELYTSDRIRKEEDLKSKKWAKRINIYLETMENLFWPDLFIIGGGASKKFEKLFEYFDLRTKIVPARLLNNAGIIGAALAAGERNKS